MFVREDQQGSLSSSSCGLADTCTEVFHAILTLIKEKLLDLYQVDIYKPTLILYLEVLPGGYTHFRYSIQFQIIQRQLVSCSMPHLGIHL